MKYSYIKIYIFVSALLSLSFLQSCRTVAPCINKESENMLMKWGDFNEQKRLYDGYVLHTDGLLQKYYTDTIGVEISKNIAYISNDDVCKITKFYYWAMKKVQTCYEPGENLKYLTLINDNYNTYWNVVWNQDFNTGSNKYLKIVYDSLNSIINRVEK